VARPASQNQRTRCCSPLRLAEHETASRTESHTGAGSAGRTLDAASLSETALAARPAEWLGPFIDPKGGPLIDGPSLKRAVSALAPIALKPEMDRMVPERIELPSGSTRRIDYRGPSGPFVEASTLHEAGLLLM